jgi:uncharacterized protein (TIGR03118 family)
MRILGPRENGVLMQILHEVARGTSGRGSARRRGGMVALAVGVVTALVPLAGGAAHAEGVAFHETDLISNRDDIPAQFHDTALQNPWGMSSSPTSPVWVSDNGAEAATLYSSLVPGLKVTLPGGVTQVDIEGGAVTGQVFNSDPDAQDFVVHDPADPTKAARASFLFVTEDGTIDAWSPTVDVATAHTVVDNGANAVYKGLAMATSEGATYLYAANFRSGRIEVYDAGFQPVELSGLFTDFEMPASYAPFNIQLLDGRLYVTYAQRDAGLEDDVPGRGRGFVDVFETDGTLVGRLVTRGGLNSPWGLAIAPEGFGDVGGALLVGNFGDGRIHAYDPVTGAPMGELRGDDGKPIAIDGLWGLMFGNGTTFPADSLLFTAGPNDEEDGLFGTITAGAPSGD